MLLLLLIIVTIFIVILYTNYIKNNYKIKIIENNEDLYKYHNKIKIFEKTMSQWYPLNEKEQFKISHGDDYFKFFERMGKLYIFIILNNTQNIIGTLFCILRTIECEKIWYICDLKIHPQYRRRWIPYNMLLNSFKLMNISNKFYAISMNENTKYNNIVKFSQKMGKILKFNIKNEIIKIYKLDYITMMKAKNILEKYKGKIYFIKLNGIKDIILKSTQNAMNLYHVNFINNINYVKCKIKKNFFPIFSPNSSFMFCFLKSDNINNILKLNNIETKITSSLIHNGLKNYDFLQTSEI